MENTSDLVERARDLVLKHLCAVHPVSHEYDLKPLAEVILALAERLEILAHGQQPLPAAARCNPVFEAGGDVTHDCETCGNARCVDCVFRHHHDECRNDCPDCCPPDQSPVTYLS